MTRVEGLQLIAKRIRQRPWCVVTKPGAISPPALQVQRSHSVFTYVPMLDDDLAVWMFDNGIDMQWFRLNWAAGHEITPPQWPLWLAEALNNMPRVDC